MSDDAWTHDQVVNAASVLGLDIEWRGEYPWARVSRRSADGLTHFTFADVRRLLVDDPRPYLNELVRKVAPDEFPV